jgi:hypothetical protein
MSETDAVLAKQDLAYHQIRILMLVAAVSSTNGHAGKLDGLTKLAKLDFLVRYPALAPVVLDVLDQTDPRLNLSESDRMEPTAVESPMTRYKYGPWDDRYYPVIGALVGRGLLRYKRGRRGSVALAPTPEGKRMAETLAGASAWKPVNDRCIAIAEASAGLSGNALKDLIYQRLAGFMDRAHRQVIK